MVLGVFGLYGYIYQKKFVSKLLWQFCCVPFTAALGYRLANVVLSDPGENTSVYIVAVIVSTLLVVPFIYAIMKYSYFSNQMWLAS